MKNISKILSYTILLILSGFLLSGCKPSEETVSKYNQVVSDADMLIEGKEYSSAMEKLSDATGLIPQRYDAYERIVDILLLKNRLDDAKKLVDESANKLGEDDRARLYLAVGEAFYTNREYSKALACFELAKGTLESGNTVNLEIAKVYLQKGNIEGAKSILKGNFEDELNSEAKLLYSYVLSTTNTQQALEIVKAIQPSEQWNDIYLKWEAVLSSLNEDELFNSAKLAQAYIDGGYPYLAISVLEPKKGEMQEYIDGMYLLGKAYYESGKYQESIDTLAGVTTLSNLNQYLYWTIARSYYLLDDINNATSYYDSAVSYAGDSADVKVYQEYLDLLMDNNQTTKAEEILRKAEKIFTDPWVDIYYIKLSYLTKQNEKSVYYSNRIQYEELEGNYKRDYLYWKTKISIENSQIDEAKRTLDVYWNLDKYDPRYNLLMGQLRFQEGILDEARSYSKKAIEYDTERLVTDEAQKLLARID